MSYVNAGVLSGSERVIDGTVLINDRSNLFGSWKGFDLESGIVEYIVGVGSSPGNHLKSLLMLMLCRCYYFSYSSC